MTSLTYTIYRSSNEKIGQNYDWLNPSNAPTTAVFAELERRGGSNYSSSHPRDRDGKYRHGGSWLMYKARLSKSGAPVTAYRYAYRKAYAGSFVCTASYPVNPFSTEEAAWLDNFNLGAKAHAALSPTKPDFTAALSLLELKDFVHPLKTRLNDLRSKLRRANRDLYRRNPRRIPNRRRTDITSQEVIQGGAEWHLAIEFGWKPLLSDIRNFVRTFNGRKKRFDQLLRDEGRGVHRRVNLSGADSTGRAGNVTIDSQTTTTAATSYNSGMAPTLITQCHPSGPGATTTTTNRSTKYSWAEGKSRYWLPPGPRDAQWRKRIMRKIMGAYVSPSTVYNLIPWTWLVDYFTGLGDFMNAVSPGVEDRIIFDYAYVMTTTIKSSSKACSQLYYNSTVTNDGPKSTIGRADAYSEASWTYKVRSCASLFGWGFSNESLTDHQMGILGALGLSRLPEPNVVRR